MVLFQVAAGPNGDREIRRRGVQPDQHLECSEQLPSKRPQTDLPLIQYFYALAGQDLQTVSLEIILLPHRLHSLRIQGISTEARHPLEDHRDMEGIREQQIEKLK